MTKANGTEAKEIALHFLKMTQVERATSAIIGRTIAQTKHILEAGYTKDEIIAVIDHVVGKGIHMYSIGYVSSCINDVLRELRKDEESEKAKLVQQELEAHQAELRKAVTSDGESAKRNEDKARRLGVQSRKREKFNFDMFEK